jgi:hypothetical protein
MSQMCMAYFEMNEHNDKIPTLTPFRSCGFVTLGTRMNDPVFISFTGIR